MAKVEVPAWITTNLKTPGSWKIWFRCWVAAWASFVIILPHKSLMALGNAAFFASVASIALPPSMPVQLFLFSIFIVVLGMSVGWAISCTAMRAALAARNQQVLKSSLQTALETAAGAANPDAVFSIEIFNGTFLDAKSSAVYGVFLGVASFFFALCRAKFPKLTLFSTFGNVVVDIMCSYGPLFPVAQYTLPSSLLISVGVYAAIALVCTLFIFPDTSNFRALGAMVGIADDVKNILALQDEVIQSAAEWESGLTRGIDEGSKEKRKGLAGKLDGMRTRLLMSMQAVPQITGLIDAEFNFGLWSGGDVRSVEQPLSLIVARICSIRSFLRLIMHFESDDVAPGLQDDRGKPPVSESSSEEDVYILRELNGEEQSSERRLTDSPEVAMMSLARSATASLREESVNALAVVSQVLRAVNSRRMWSCFTLRKGQPTSDNGDGSDEKGPTQSSSAGRASIGAGYASAHSKLDEAEERLKQAIASFERQDRLTIVEPFLDARIQAESAKGDPNAPRTPALRLLLLAAMFSSLSLSSAQSVHALLLLLQKVTAKRTHRRLWAPKVFRAFGAILLHVFHARREGDSEEERMDFVAGAGEGERGIGEDERPNAGWGAVFEPEDSASETTAGQGQSAIDEKSKPVAAAKTKPVKEKPYQLDPDSRPPTNVFQTIMSGLFAVYKWNTTPEAIFAWKYVIATIAIWLPSAFKSTAFFMYSQKSLWAMITAQSIVNVYIADQMYTSVARLSGTFVGLLLGLLAWYIGNGRGRGTPYGTAASVAVFLVPVLFIRIFAPPKHLMPILMCSVTFVLIVGYSWLDNHIQILGNVGVGWSVAWRRWTLVVIGFAVAFVVMLFPVQSGREAVRLRNAAIIKELSSLYSFLISTWINSGAEAAERLKNEGKVEVGGGNGSANEAEAAEKHADDVGRTDPAYGTVRPAWSLEFRARIIALGQQIGMQQQRTMIAKWEGNLRGRWPLEEYMRLVELEYDMLGSLAQLGGALALLDPAWRDSLKRRSRVLNPNFITDVMSLFALVAQSLRTGEAVPQVLPTTLMDRLLYHFSKQRAEEIRGATRPNEVEATDDGGITKDGQPLVSAARSSYVKESDIQRVQSLEFLHFATGISAVYMAIVTLDEMHKVTRNLCGEIPFHGFDRWRQDFETRL